MARKPRKDNITVVGMLILEDGTVVPMDEATEEQLERFRENAARRGQVMLNAYYAQHPEEYKKLPLATDEWATSVGEGLAPSRGHGSESAGDHKGRPYGETNKRQTEGSFQL